MGQISWRFENLTHPAINDTNLNELIEEYNKTDSNVLALGASVNNHENRLLEAESEIEVIEKKIKNIQAVDEVARTRIEEVNSLLSESITDLSESITLYNDEIYINNIITGMYITKASGYEGLAISNANSICTDFVFVRANTSVKISGCYITSNRSICGYDLNHNFVSVLSEEKEGTEIVIDIPNNVTFIRITGRKDNPIHAEYVGSVQKYDNQESIQNFTMDDGYMISSLSGYEGVRAKQATSSATDFIRVLPNSVLKIDKCYIASSRSICAYNSNKEFVSVLATGEDYTSISVAIPSNARYIRITSKIGEIPNVEYLSKANKEILSPQYQNSASLFDNATLKPVLTFVDDDTYTMEYVLRQKNLCDTLGIKCSFACLTSQVENEEGFSDLLLSFERDGFPIVLHGYTQGDFYNTDTMLAEEEEDFVHGMQMLNKYGFSDYKAVWVTPFGSSRPDEQTLAIKWGFEGLLTSGRPNSAINNPYEMNPMSRYDIQRISLGSNSATQESDLVNNVNAIKLAIDKASECNGWVCVSTHSAYVVYRNGGADNAMREIVEYAKSKGFDIRTINEELRRRMPIYNYYEKF